MEWSKNVKKPMLACIVLCILSLLLIGPLATSAGAAETVAMGEELRVPMGEKGSVADTTLVQDETHKWHKDMDIWFMLMLVAFLMLFIKKFEWGICLAVMLVTAGSFLVYAAIKQFAWGWAWNQEMVIMSIVCSITVVIAIGVYLGTVKMWQYLLSGILFAPAFVLVEWWMFYYLKGVVDPGGSMLVHMMAAYWGWGVILALREKRAFDEPMNVTTHSISFVWLAAMLLFVLWPSFVTALLPADQGNWGMITCYMSGLGAIISVYICCMIYEKKVNPLVYTYAFLCGPVAIGSPLLSVGPWGALAIGAIAGIISATSFIYIHERLCKAMGVLDVMGVHNLHGVGGWFGAFCGAALAAGGVNIVCAIGVFGISLITGMISGLVLKATRGIFEDHQLFRDDTDFSEWHEEPLGLTDAGTVTKCD